MIVAVEEAKPVKVRKVTLRPHYVENKVFSQAVVDHVNSTTISKAEEAELPQMNNYIGDCFMKISTGLSHKPNFMRYTYRDDMVMDGVENCVRAIMNFDVTKATRTGLPNAFAYFTQIVYFAFLRRIAKEKKQQEIKEKIIDHAGIEAFAQFDGDSSQQGQSMVERVRIRSESFRTREPKTSTLVAIPRKRAPHKARGVEDFYAAD